jgi:hypothetical protein
VFPVRRTFAAFVSGASSSTVPALGIPSEVLPLIHGWRASDGSARLATLARSLRLPGLVRAPGPSLPVGARWLSLHLNPASLQVSVTADLRNQAGDVRQVALGSAASTARTVRARVPAGSWELEALELDEPAGLEATSGHQNAESLAPAASLSTAMVLGPLLVLGPSGRQLGDVALGGWTGVGAATAHASPAGASTAAVNFVATGEPGIVRPPQPSDARPLPVLVDPGTAAAASRAGRLSLTIDGLPVLAHVAGVLRRFPTVGADAAGFVVADESTLASALDAQLPGQGRPDELWISSHDLGGLRRALSTGPDSALASAIRADVERRLRSAPIARGVLGTLVAAGALAGALALLGIMVALLGAARDRRAEEDLIAQGLGPRALLTELRLRLAASSALGVAAGLVVAALLTRLAVGGVQAASTLAAPRPPLVTVVPWVQLGGWGLVAFAALTALGWTATARGEPS